VNHNGENQLFFWYQEKDFVVIVREIQPDYLLITAYSVDKETKYGLKKHFEHYLETKKTSLRK